MRPEAENIMAFYRIFSSLEREEICCGTVSPAQSVALQTLTRGTWDVSRLASHARVTRGAMTRLVDGLEKRGWVERARGEGDARRVRVRLTPAGRKEAHRLRSLTEQGVARIIAAIPAAERPGVLHSIGLLAEAAGCLRDQPDSCRPEGSKTPRPIHPLCQSE